jgi:hypothetical protein
VEDGVTSLHPLLKHGPIAEISLHQLAAQTFEVPGLRRRSHQGHHVVAAFAELPDDRAPDEARPTGDEGLHRFLLRNPSTASR